MNENYNGIADDPRSEEKKAEDYAHEDLAMGEIVLNWVDENAKIIKTYPIQNQDGSLSCVAQAVAKLLAIHEVREGREYKQLCPKIPYDFRANYPDGGMWLPNALSIACKIGACIEEMLPCDMKDEAFMNDKSLIREEMINDALNYRGLYYFEIKSRSIDEIAKVNEQGYGVLLGFRFDYNEWVDVPFVDPNSKMSLGHGVAETDYYLHEQEKSCNIDDSWGPGYGKGGRRTITETFLNARCFYAGYITSLPNYIFTKTLRYGSKGLDVKMLQTKLNTQGFILKVDGNFGKMTKLAVEHFQTNHGLKSDGIVGAKTNAELNKI